MTPLSTVIKRGEIHFVENRGGIGSEQKNSRPCVVVSNNANNEYSPVIEIVYMTTQPKKGLPTHVVLEKTSNGRCEGSTVLCEQVFSISKERLQPCSYEATVSDSDMVEIDKALCVSLGLDQYIDEEIGYALDKAKQFTEDCNNVDGEKEELKAENERLKVAVSNLNTELDIQRTNSKMLANGADDKIDQLETENKQMQVEIEFYKRKYDELLGKIMDRL